ncbi:MAG TPA: DNA translocase FtsK, partial [Petrimonas sp.]|nr:DNA translocase FtsK [Petrimonas sp.]
TDKPETETEPEVLLQNREQTPLPVTQNTVPPIRKKEPANDVFEVFVPKDEIQVAENKPEEKASPLAESDTNEETDPDVEILEDYDPKKDLSSFAFPTMDLLKVYNTGNRQVDMQEQNENKDKIIRTLRNYGIEITSIKATVGPTITLYEIVPQAGVRISRIRNLEDDIALSLSALGIRIIAPMPGKGTIGIEVPNKEPQIVSMQSVIASVKFQECTYDLPVALGKTITNEVFIFDLAKMPHLLVAGATGQGKSVGLNAIITSLLYKKHPSEMKMVLIDPKMVEFNIYSTIEKHYLAKLPDEEKAIITDVTKVTQTLNSLTKEMDDRYELLMRAHVRAIKEYNEKFIKRKLNPKNGHRYLPYIVVVIDEFGDLIMTAGKEIEMPIARIAQKARAVGMHMVIATQRPTTNIITGTIKANFPARMAFRVTSQIDSRTILDATGANQLIGRGDMLFSQGSNLIRIQCAFVDTPEIEDISQYIGKQRGYESAFALPEVVSADSEDKPGAVDLNERDTLFDEAARLIVIHQQGSTSLIQRKFSIGYNRAGRLMDQLETAGIVGPAQGSKPRDVYISDEYSLEKLLDSLR